MTVKRNLLDYDCYTPLADWSKKSQASFAHEKQNQIQLHHVLVQ